MRSPTLLAAFGLILTTLPAAAQQPSTKPTFAELRRSLPYRPPGDRVALGDWDGDGQLDLVSAGRGVLAVGFPVVPPEITLLLNDGDANFFEVAATSFPLTPNALALGDVDGDGDLDAVSGAVEGLWLLRNDGQGGFTESLETVLPPGAFVTGIAVAQLVGGAAPDVVLTSTFGTFVARNRGDGTFEPAQAIGGPNQRTADVEAVDLDRDGDLDVAFTGAGVFTYANDGAGNLTPGFALPSIYSTEALTTGDVDRDGWNDLVFRGANLTLLLNDRQGGFTDASAGLPVLGLEGPFPTDLLLVDLDADGDLDLASGTGVLRGDGTGGFELDLDGYPGFDYARGGTNVQAGDLDADQDVDLVIGGLQRLLLGNGSFAWEDTAPQAPTAGTLLGAIGPVAVADFDGNGSPDAVYAGGLFRNDGRGVLALEEDAVPENGFGFYPQPGDVDGDGDSDVFFADSGLYYANDGRGQFSAGEIACQPARLYTSREAALADFDDDGDLDVFLARVRAMGGFDTVSFHPAPDALWMNDGSGCFTDVSDPSLPAMSSVSFGVDHGDLDGDGKIDLLASSGQLYGNVGGGAFEDRSDRVAASGLDVALGDLDRDGDLDAYFAGTEVVAWNDGKGALLATAPGVVGVAGERVELGDLDGDGRLDVSLGIFRRFGCCLGFETRSVFFRRDASGAFQPLEAPANVGRYQTLADFDRDGDLDVFDGGRVYFNLSRQLVRGTYPRVGRPLELELSGPAFERWALFASLRLFPQLPGERLRERLIGPIVYRRFGSFDESRTATVRLQVPDDPVLVGATAYWQAILGPELVWSSFEVTELSGF